MADDNPLLTARELRVLVCPPGIDPPASTEEGDATPLPRVPVEDAELRFSPQATSISQQAFFINNELFNGSYAKGEVGSLPLNMGLYQPWNKFFETRQANALDWAELSQSPKADNTNVQDILRFRSRKCWYYYDNKLLWLDNPDLRIEASPRVFSLQTRDNAGDDENYPDLSDTFPAGPFGELAEVKELSITSNQHSLILYFNNDRSLFRRYMMGGFSPNINGFRPTIPDNPARIYYDTVFEISLPFSDQFARKFSNLKNIFVFNSLNRYNYYIRGFEEGVENLAIPENILPNLYVWLSFIESLRRRAVNNAFYRDLYKIVSLGGKLVNNFLVKETETGAHLKLNLGLFEAYILFYPIDEENILNEIIKKQKNLVMKSGEVNFLSIGNTVNNASLQKKNNFPMLVEMSFNTPDRALSALAGAFTQFDHDLALIKEVILANTDPQINSETWRDSTEKIKHKDIQRTKTYNKIIQAAEIAPASPDSDLGTLETNLNLKEWNLNKWLKLYKQDGMGIFNSNQNDIITYLGLPHWGPPTIPTIRRADRWPSESEGRLPGETDTQWERRQGLGSAAADFAPFLERNLNSSILRAKIKSLAREHNRTWKEVIAGKKAYSQTLFYRIEKSIKASPGALRRYGTASSTENKLQDFYFMNSPDLEMLQWLDTQVKYGKTYQYRVFAYQVVFGTQYRYVRRSGDRPLGDTRRDVWGRPASSRASGGVSRSDITDDMFPDSPSQEGSSFVGVPSLGEIGELDLEASGVIPTYDIAGISPGPPPPNTSLADSFKLRVYCEPCLKLVEVPFHEFENTIMDSPPCQPVAEVFPHRGRPDKISFFLQDNPGRIMQHPIAFNDAEKEMYDAVRAAQELPADSPIMFRSDDRIESFLVYRTLTRPRAFSDFHNSLLAEVSTNIERKNYEQLCSLKASAASFVDNTIRPNLKYYYMFRSKDVHGHLSNPSPIFEIELLEMNNAVYPMVDIIEFPVEEAVYVKPARKYIYISPSVNQLQIDSATTNAVFDKQIELDEEQYADLASQIYSLPVAIGDEDTVWGQKFKIRMTSRATGRKIEFDVNFTHTHNPISDREICLKDSQIDPAEIDRRMMTSNEASPDEPIVSIHNINR
jgi:hypothetical protein